MSDKPDDAVWQAFLKKYDRVYNPEANAKATADKAEATARKKMAGVNRKQ